MAKKTTTTTELRRCVGSRTFGIEANEAATSRFPVQPSRKDGLGVMCKEHWTIYTRSLRQAAVARKATVEDAIGEVIVASALDAVDAAAARERRAPRRTRDRQPLSNHSLPRRASTPQPKAPAVAQAEALLAATETLGGTAYTEAIGSDEVQAALETLNGHQTPMGESIDGTTEADAA